MKLNDHLNALAQARYKALDKIVQGTRMREAGERELASIDSMINLANDITQTPEDKAPTE